MADKSLVEKLEQKAPTLQEHFLRRGLLYASFDAHTFSGATYENKVLLRNPSGSGVNCIFFFMDAFFDLAATTSQLNQVFMEIRRDPTWSATGAARATVNRRAGSSDTTNLLVNNNPTITALGTIVGGYGDINKTASEKGLILTPNTTYLIRLRVNVTANSIITRVVWAEDPA